MSASQPVSVVIIGCGNRGSDAYGAWCAEHPELVQVVAVADPRDDYREPLAERLGVPEDRRYRDWREVLAQPRMADGLILAVTEDQRMAPLAQAFERGYFVLCEKPVARDQQELEQIDTLLSDPTHRMMVCHVLRYQPFFAAVKRILASGELGRIVHMQHNENIGYWHFTHSYVRGNIRNSQMGGPLILAKTSHDLDLLTWFADSEALRVSSVGSIAHFRPQDAPPGAPEFCADGCPAALTCPHNAVRYYVNEMGESRQWPASMVTAEPGREVRLAAVAHGQFGRCVYRNDNTQPDHQITTIEFANGIRAVLTASAFTAEDTRTLRIFCTGGELLGHMGRGEIEVRPFAASDPTTGVRPPGQGTSRLVRVVPGQGHELGDDGLMSQYIAQLGDPVAEAETSWRRSRQSHWIAFAAETSRAQQGMWQDVPGLSPTTG